MASPLQILERTRLERERRKQQKLEQTSATTIQVSCWAVSNGNVTKDPAACMLSVALQAAFRSYRAVKAAKQEARQDWQQQYGQRGEHADQ